MAWRSSGGTNDEMVDNLKRFGVIRSASVEEAFRAVDRKYFVPPCHLSLAHADQPIREGMLHISAPHIYGSVLEALDLPSGGGGNNNNTNTSNNHDSASSLSSTTTSAQASPPPPMTFLNIGSGTGYLSCLVAHMLGPNGSVFSLELQPEAVAHSQQATAAWKQARASAAAHAPTSSASCFDPHMVFVQGNGLRIDATKGEAAIGFDRIYIGAAADRLDLPLFADLLRPGGVLVGPVEDDLVRVVRVAKSQAAAPSPPSSPHHYHGRGRYHLDDDDEDMTTLSRSFRTQRMALLSDDFTLSLLTGVRFSPLIHDSPSVPSSRLPVVIPSRVWEPAVHRFYPDTFRQACRTVLLCASAAATTTTPAPPPLPPSPPAPAAVSTQTCNVASFLPRALWMEIFSYTHRDWFEPPLTEEMLLRRRLQQLEASLQKAQKTCQDLEKRLRMTEDERDVYRRMARSFQMRMEQVLGEPLASEILEGAIFVMHPALENGGDNDDDDEADGEEVAEDDDDVAGEPGARHQHGGMFDDHEGDDDDDNDNMEEEETDTEADDVVDAMAISNPTEMAVVRAARTVSIGSESL